jgi:hypothetical protein
MRRPAFRQSITFMFDEMTGGTFGERVFSGFQSHIAPRGDVCTANGSFQSRPCGHKFVTKEN